MHYFKFFLFFVLSAFSVYSQTVPVHSYPRTALHQWGGYPKEWQAQFDLIMIGHGAVTADFVNTLKAMNPNIIILPTGDFNVGMYLPVDSIWYTREATGVTIDAYGPGSPLLDFTDFCPMLTDNGWDIAPGPERYSDFLPRAYVKRVDFSIIYGVATDGFWDGIGFVPGYNNIDINRNGTPDNKEGINVDGEWSKGAVKIASGVRAKLGPSKVFLVNGAGLGGNESLYNGRYFEHLSGFNFDYYGGLGSYQYYMEILSLPHVNLMDTDPTYASIEIGEGRESWDVFRFWLGTSMLGDGYHQWEDMGSQEHFYVLRYDEYELNLGQPLDNNSFGYGYHRLEKGNSEAVLVRFFEQGAVIVNATSSEQTVTDADLKTLQNYLGPYFRFQGGQDPAFNNGQSFNSVILKGKPIFQDGGGKTFVGDAILLVKQPMTVITDIIVDNDKPHTTPGSQPAVFVGDWNPLEFWASQTWTSGYRTNYLAFYTGWSDAGNGSKTATFTPAIWVKGNYEIYEWHGIVNEPGGSPQRQAATDAPHVINHAKGSTIFKINQSMNIGKWNKLGTFIFNTGTAGNLTIKNSASGSNKIVIADAIKFVYKGGASIIGKVTDQDLAIPVEGVLVKAVSGNNTDSAFSQADGSYGLPVPQGNYTLTFSKSGYVTAQQNINVNQDQEFSVNLNLKQDAASPKLVGNASVEIISETEVIIHWMTDKPCHARVDYGMTTAYGSDVQQNAVFQFHHDLKISGLSLNVTYHYQISFTDKDNHTQALPDNSFLIPIIEKPANLVATRGDGRAYLSWTALSDTNVVEILVYQTLTSGNGYTKIDSISAGRKTYIHTAAVNNAVNYYVVRSINKYGITSGFSNEASAKPLAGIEVLKDDTDGDVVFTNKTGDHLTGWMEGGWLTGDYNDGFHIKSHDKSGTATFPAPNGTAELFVTYPSDNDPTITPYSATYTVYHSGGMSVFNIDQNQNYSAFSDFTWNKLGTGFTFSKDSGKVVVSAGKKGNSIFNLVDAMRFVSTSDSPLVVGIKQQNIISEKSGAGRLAVFPNPFNSSIKIRVNPSQNHLFKSKEAIVIFNQRGERVRHFKVEDLNNEIFWNGQNERGQEMSSGVYWIAVVAGENRISVKRILYVK